MNFKRICLRAVDGTVPTKHTPVQYRNYRVIHNLHRNITFKPLGTCLEFREYQPKHVVSVVSWYEAFIDYNTERIHSALKYLVPAKFDEQEKERNK